MDGAGLGWVVSFALGRVWMRETLANTPTPSPTLCTRLSLLSMNDQQQAMQVQVFSAGVDDPVFSSWYPELKEQGTLQHRGSGDGAGGEDFDVQRFKVRVFDV